MEKLKNKTNEINLTTATTSSFSFKYDKGEATTLKKSLCITKFTEDFSFDKFITVEEFASFADTPHSTQREQKNSAIPERSYLTDFVQRVYEHNNAFKQNFTSKLETVFLGAIRIVCEAEKDGSVTARFWVQDGLHRLIVICKLLSSMGENFYNLTLLNEEELDINNKYLTTITKKYGGKTVKDVEADFGINLFDLFKKSVFYATILYTHDKAMIGRTLLHANNCRRITEADKINAEAQSYPLGRATRAFADAVKVKQSEKETFEYEGYTISEETMKLFTTKGFDFAKKATSCAMKQLFVYCRILEQLNEIEDEMIKKAKSDISEKELTELKLQRCTDKEVIHKNISDEIAKMLAEKGDNIDVLFDFCKIAEICIPIADYFKSHNIESTYSYKEDKYLKEAKVKEKNTTMKYMATIMFGLYLHSGRNLKKLEKNVAKMASKTSYEKGEFFNKINNLVVKTCISNGVGNSTSSKTLLNEGQFLEKSLRFINEARLVIADYLA